MRPDPDAQEITETELWLTKLGVKFVDVRFFTKNQITTGQQVADPVTLEVTIKMEMDRLGAQQAVWPVGNQWALYTPRRQDGKVRLYPSREAAEMVAIHNG